MTSMSDQTTAAVVADDEMPLAPPVEGGDDEVSGEQVAIDGNMDRP
jgi:hypothetical protein